MHESCSKVCAGLYDARVHRIIPNLHAGMSHVLNIVSLLIQHLSQPPRRRKANKSQTNRVRDFWWYVMLKNGIIKGLVHPASSS